jgi:MFS family permease
MSVTSPTVPIRPAVAASQQASRRLRQFRSVSLALLVASGMVNMMDRSTLAIAAPLVRQDLGLSVRDMGMLLSAFLWTYAIAQLPIGALVDRAGPRLLLACGQILWSVAQGACGLVGSFGQFFAARMVLGIGEAPQFPICARVVRDCFAPRDRGLPTGIFLTASTLGPALSAPFITWLMLSFGWRWMFAIMGIAGVAVALVWFIFYRNPAKLDLDADDRRYLAADEAASARHISFAEWRSLFAYRTTWGMVLGFFGMIYLVWVYTAWLPGYLEMQRHMSIPHTGFVAAIPFLFGTVGSLCGGRLVDRLAAGGVAPINACKYPAAIGLTGMALFTGAAALVDSDSLAVGLMCLALFIGFGGMSGSWAMVSVAAPKNTVASLGSLMNCGGYFGGALAPMVTGMVVQSTHSFVPALLTATVIGLASAACYLLGVTKPLPEPQP